MRVKSFLIKEIKDMFPLADREVIPIYSRFSGAFHVSQGIVDKECFCGVQPALL